MNDQVFDELDLGAVSILSTLATHRGVSPSDHGYHNDALQASTICPSDLLLHKEFSESTAAAEIHDFASLRTPQDLCTDSLFFTWPLSPVRGDSNILQEYELPAPTPVNLSPVQQNVLSSNQCSNSRMIHILSKKILPSANVSMKGKNAGRHRLQSRQWEEHRTAIKSLYVDDDRTLAATRQVMKDEHGFHASYATCICFSCHK